MTIPVTSYNQRFRGGCRNESQNLMGGHPLKLRSEECVNSLTFDAEGARLYDNTMNVY